MNKYADYRKTSSPFLKTVPSHWIDVKLRNCYTTKSICNTSNEPLLSVFLNRGVVIYTDTDMKQVHKPSEDMKAYQLVLPGDFVLNNQQAWRGSVGVSSHRGIVSPAYIVMSPITENNPRFMNYMLREIACTSQFVLASKGVGSIQRILSPIKLKSCIVVLPPRDEQDQIVRYLDWQVSKINRLIAAKRKQVGLISASKQAYISHLVTHGLNNSVKKKDSGIHWLGNIPAHWEVRKLRTILSPKSEKNRPDLPLLSVVREKGVILRDVEDKEANHNFIPDDLSGYKVVHANQFVINKMKAWQGSYGISPCDGIVSPAYFVFDINFENLEYFHYAIRSKVYVNFFAQASDGIRVGQWDLSVDKMKNIPFIIPPMEEQKEIVLQIKAQTVTVENACQKIQAQITALEALRTRLISDVVTGQIDVRGIEIPEYSACDENASIDQETEEDLYEQGDE